MVPFLVFAGMILVVAFVIRAGMKQHQRMMAMLARFGEQRGFQLTKMPGGRSGQLLVGQQHGREVRLWTYTTGSGKSRTSWVAVGVQPRGEVLLTFNLSPQHFGSKILELFGAKEITVGDPAFDEKWYVRTNQPEFFAAALVPSIREKLMAEPRTARSGDYVLRDRLVRFSERGWFNDEATLLRLEAMLPLLHELADVAEVSAGYRS